MDIVSAGLGISLYFSCITTGPKQKISLKASLCSILICHSLPGSIFIILPNVEKFGLIENEYYSSVTFPSSIIILLISIIKLSNLLAP